MIQYFTKLMRNTKGFTLVELMVVVAIIGVLTAIAIPVYNSVTDKAEVAAIVANLRTIDSAVLQYKTVKDADADPADINALVSENFLQAVPTAPGTYDLQTVGSNYKAVVTIKKKISTYEEGSYYLGPDGKLEKLAPVSGGTD
jgi:type IV pilus assembly protein PilA